MIRIAIDAMGGDNAPAEIVAGAVDAVRENKDIKVIIIGTDEARECIPKDLADSPQIVFKKTTEVISTSETPTKAIREKKDSSLVVGLKMVHDEEADALVSAGNTGAVLAGGQFLAGRIPGVKRSPLAPLIPTLKGQSLLIDCGANVDAKPVHLEQFAMMGSVYMESILGIKNPRVAIVNIGAEEEKGNALVKETFPILKENKNINFIGNIEARDIPAGFADVIVCEAFVGNVILKMYEGVSGTMTTIIKEVLMSSLKTKIGAALISAPLKKRLKALSSSAQGGAPLLGLNGLVVKAHGNSGRVQIKNACLNCVDFTKQDVTGKMRELFS